MGNNKENKILEEIQKRVFAEDEKLAEQKENESLREATFEVLKENTSLSDRAIERIAKEVRQEVERKQKFIIRSTISAFITIGMLGIFAFLIFKPKEFKSQEYKQEKKVKTVKKRIIVNTKPQKNKKAQKRIPKPTEKKVDKNTYKKLADQTKKLNNLIQVSNKNIVEINKSISCIENFWYAAQYSINKKSRFRRSYDCAFNNNEALMEKHLTILKGTELNTSNIDESIKQYNKSIKELIKKYNSLLIYQRMKTYEKDNFKEAEIIINDFIGIIENVKKTKNEFSKSIEESFNELVSKTAIDTNPYPKITEVILDDIKMMDGWSLNVSRNTWTNSIPYDQIYANYRKYRFIDEKSYYQENTDRNTRYYYKNLLKNIKSRLNKKSIIINRRELSRWESDKYANEAYRSLDPQYLINNYNYLLDRSYASKKIILKKHYYIWNVTKNENSGDYPFKKFDKVKNINKGKVQVAIKENSIKPPLFKVLSRLIGYLNKEFFQKVNGLNREIGSYQQRVKSRIRSRVRNRVVNFNYHRYSSVSQTDFEELIHSLKKENIDKDVIDQFTIMKNIADEIYYKAAQLSLKSQKDQNFSKQKEINLMIPDIRKMIVKLDTQRKFLSDNIFSIYENYKVDYKNPLIRTASKFSEILDLGANIFKKEASLNKLSQEIKKEHDLLTEKQFEFLDGVPRGSRRYSSPYTKYEYFNRSVKSFVRDLNSKKFKKDKKNLILLRSYNSIIDNYNSFVEIAVRNREFKSMILNRTKVISLIN
ncbi:MAG: hypothetical protein GY714_22665 [Desulfobacterales bacterium]|nr:hypothetical protein [Desulfobacterales bacterium]